MLQWSIYIKLDSLNLPRFRIARMVHHKAEYDVGAVTRWDRCYIQQSDLGDVDANFHQSQIILLPF
jgi:hypothetical protein